MKYLKVPVTRTQSSELYLGVPDSFELKEVYLWDDWTLKRLIDEQLYNNDDWSDECNYEVDGVKETDEKEFNDYRNNFIDETGKVIEKPT